MIGFGPVAVGHHRGPQPDLDLTGHPGRLRRGAWWSSAAFVAWERHIDHPMLPLRFFANRRYSAAIASLALVLFALLGLFFLVTQYLQFCLGFSPLKTGLGLAPIALVLLVAAPSSVALARRFGTKPVVAGGLTLIAVGLGLAVPDDCPQHLPGLHAVVRAHRIRGGTDDGPLDRVGHGLAPAGRRRCRLGHQ